MRKCNKQLLNALNICHFNYQYTLIKRCFIFSMKLQYVY